MRLMPATARPHAAARCEHACPRRQDERIGAGGRWGGVELADLDERRRRRPRELRTSRDGPNRCVLDRERRRAVEFGFEEDELLEKWSRDSKILDIFEGTQQIQLLIIARRLLDKKSSELR